MNEVVNILPVKVQEGDLVLVEVREGLPPARRDFLQEILEEHAEDAKVHFLVLPENTLHDIRRLPLTEMISLRELLEAFIVERVQDSPIGEA
jgi:hypothetical protein